MGAGGGIAIYWQVELTGSNPTGGDAPEGLRPHQVVPVHVKDLPCPPVDAGPGELPLALGAGQPHLPQVVGHPHQEPVREKPIW